MYEVLYRSTLDQTQALNTTDNSTFTLSLRVELVTYNIMVRAYTVAGAGEESMPVVVVMTSPIRKFLNYGFGNVFHATFLSPAPGTPAPPMVPAMDEITSLSAIVRWNPIPERFANGEITNYVINYRIYESVNRLVVPECIIGGAENADRNLTVGGDQTNATLQNLSNDI